MRPKLLKSFVVVLIFWMVATTAYWSFQEPRVNLDALRSLKSLLPFIPAEVPAEASILGSIGVQADVLLYWTVPVLAAALVTGLIGFGSVWAVTVRKNRERAKRADGTGNYRGVELTLGPLPLPASYARDELELSADPQVMAKVSEKEFAVLTDILGVISAADSPYAGEGVTGSLLEHASALAFKALSTAKYPGLAALVVAGHELTKLSYRKKPDGSWAPSKNPDRDAARILGSLESWFALPHREKLAVQMAVKFHSNPRGIPDLEGDPAVYRLARELLSGAEATPAAAASPAAPAGAAAAAEAAVFDKPKPVDKSEVPDVIFETFLRTLPSLSFQSRGLPKGVAAVAWKMGNRVYMIEIKLRETVMAKMPAEARAALSGGKEGRARLQPFTLELLKALDQRGWLVRSINDVKVDVKEALWNIKAGKLDFKGVIIVDVPKEYMQSLPTDDSMYELSVSGPLFTPSGGSQGGMGMSRNDLLGSVLKPTAPAEEPRV